MTTPIQPANYSMFVPRRRETLGRRVDNRVDGTSNAEVDDDRRLLAYIFTFFTLCGIKCGQSAWGS